MSPKEEGNLERDERDPRAIKRESFRQEAGLNLMLGGPEGGAGVKKEPRE